VANSAANKAKRQDAFVAPDEPDRPSKQAKLVADTDVDAIKSKLQASAPKSSKGPLKSKSDYVLDGGKKRKSSKKAKSTKA
jgi:hypothetical protein